MSLSPTQAQEEHFREEARFLESQAASLSDRDVLMSEDKREVFPIELAANVEGKVIYAEKAYGAEWVYVRFINGTYKGKRGWLPFRTRGSHIRLYAVDKNQAYQTLNVTQAQYARTTWPTKGYIDFSYKNLPNRSFDFDEKEYTVDFFEKYPRSNFGIEEVGELPYLHQSCPAQPVQRNGKPCEPPPRKFQLPRYVLTAIRNAATEFNVHPAIIAAILQKESYFDPFSENLYEKNLCLQSQQKGTCPAYRWGQGMAQVGATNDREFGLEWQANFVRPKVCKKNHIFSGKCFTYLENRCKIAKRRSGVWPTYCPRASIRAVAMHASHLINHANWIRVNVLDKSGKWKETIVDTAKYMRRNLPEEFRYILGMYNRGKRPLNSIEEHYRQYGRPPTWYDDAWVTERKEGFTPSTQMGYMVLHMELINRCHVWQAAGLCGESFNGSLSGQYLSDFSDWKPRPILDKSSKRRLANDTSIPEEFLNNPNLNIDEDVDLSTIE